MDINYHCNQTGIIGVDIMDMAGVELFRLEEPDFASMLIGQFLKTSRMPQIFLGDTNRITYQGVMDAFYNHLDEHDQCAQAFRDELSGYFQTSNNVDTNSPQSVLIHGGTLVDLLEKIAEPREGAHQVQVPHGGYFIKTTYLREDPNEQIVEIQERDGFHTQALSSLTVPRLGKSSEVKIVHANDVNSSDYTGLAKQIQAMDKDSCNVLLDCLSYDSQRRLGIAYERK